VKLPEQSSNDEAGWIKITTPIITYKITSMFKILLSGLITASLVGMISCGDKPANTGEGAPGSNGDTISLNTIDRGNTSGVSGTKTCFVGITNKDTVVLSFTQSDSSVNGDLFYKFNEKDLNTGTIEGVMMGDTLVADYTFKSEGTSSIRQVVFLKHGDEMIEGFGDVEDNQGRMIFRNLSALTFDRSVVVKQTDCKNAPFISTP